MGEKSDPIKRTRARKSAAPTDDATFGAELSNPDVGDIDTDDMTSDDIEFVVSVESTEATPEQIREDIEQTRAQMSGTIDEIQERLSPKRLVNEAKETVRDATVGKVKDVMNNASESAGGIVERIKENPVPAALIGIGAYWLFGRQSRPQFGASTRQYRGESSSAYGARTGEYEYSGARQFSSSRSAGFVDTLKQHPVPATLAGLSAAWWLMDRQRSASGVGGSYGSGSRYASDYSSYGSSGWQQPRSSSLRDMASEATESASELAERTQETVAEYAARAQETVGEYTERAQTEFDRLLRDNPLALGVVAVAVGAAVGMAIPETQRERAMIGDAGQQLVEKAQNLAQDAIGKVQQGTSTQGDTSQQRS
jgi:ElaB/YqjD/DUF883 family membrane-anchored ribosome-binding protein